MTITQSNSTPTNYIHNLANEVVGQSKLQIHTTYSSYTHTSAVYGGSNVTCMRDRRQVRPYLFPAYSPSLGSAHQAPHCALLVCPMLLHLFHLSHEHSVLRLHLLNGKLYVGPAYVISYAIVLVYMYMWLRVHPNMAYDHLLRNSTTDVSRMQWKLDVPSPPSAAHALLIIHIPPLERCILAAIP